MHYEKNPTTGMAGCCAAGGTAEVFPPYLLVFLREVETVAVGSSVCA
jgi:hypothetical protein